jgi:hypothetical protein
LRPAGRRVRSMVLGLSQELMSLRLRRPNPASL